MYVVVKGMRKETETFGLIDFVLVQCFHWWTETSKLSSKQAFLCCLFLSPILHDLVFHRHLEWRVFYYHILYSPHESKRVLSNVLTSPSLFISRLFLLLLTMNTGNKLQYHSDQPGNGYPCLVWWRVCLELEFRNSSLHLVDFGGPQKKERSEQVTVCTLQTQLSRFWCQDH